jgi:two-component system, chemotaxis family, sensor kinase CheA
MTEEASYIAEFMEEISETLNRLDRQFVVLEQNPSDMDCLAEIFRDLHTIKGSCGLLGLNKLESITHSGENLLGKLRDQELTLRPDMISTLLKMMDAVWKTVACLKKDGHEGSADYSALIDTLARLEKGETENLASEAPDQSDSSSPPADDKQQTPDAKDDKSEDTNIRVDVELLDSLMNLVGEVVLARNQFSRIVQDQNDSTIQGTSQSLNRVTTELQETVMKARMQPIKNVWGKLPRMVRDLSLNCGNKVRLEMEGQDADLDKSLITAIQDPLMNIIRNAIVHGIETVEERRNLGKPEEGVIRLRAFNQSGQLHIEVQDNGRGVDFQAVKNKAMDEKHITPEQAESLNDRDCGKLLFIQGFSLTQNSLMKSAKGNGLAQTRELVEKIGGSLDIEVQPGKGATLKIKIPLTLAIIPALIISSGPNRFAIPQIGIKELIHLQGEGLQQTEEIAGSQFYRLRGNLLPLIQLNQILKNNGEHHAELNIVVLQADDNQFGLVVDKIHNTEEIVVKTLDNLLQSIQVFSGVSIMGDGEVVLILDVMGLAQNALLVSGEDSRNKLLDSVSSSQGKNGEGQGMLIVSLGNNRRMAIRLADVARLEEVKRSDLETSGEEQVVQYRGEIMPLINIPKLFNTQCQGTRDTLEVVVHTHEGKSLGLMVESILDIVQGTIDSKRASSNLLGTIITNNSVVDTINVKNIVRDFLQPA